MNIDHLDSAVPDRNPIPPRVPVDGTNPGNPYRANPTQEGFVTFGDWHILPLLAEVTTRALKAAWYQKWFVHRRLRPEEFAGRVHFHLDGLNQIPPLNRYPTLDGELLASRTTGALSAHFGPGQMFPTYLLPQAYPEGSPLHPAYPSGHATVAGACVTILKAWFDETRPLAAVFEADPSANWTTLRTVTGGPTLTVGGELNKLASNMSLARNAAGVHYRSDYTQGVQLGEQIAIGLIEEQRDLYNEIFNGVTFTRFDGTPIVV